MSDEFHVFRAPSGLVLTAGRRTVGVDPLALGPGDWVAFAPARGTLGVDLAMTLARVLVTIGSADSGVIEIMGHDPRTLSYLDLQRLRTNIGFVQGHGGLLSNRTLRDNVALPISVHLRRDEEQRVGEIMARFDLESVAHLKPHEVDGATRYRACAARALILSPPWVVIEGTGDFDAEAGPSLTWTRLMEYRARGSSAGALCLPRPSAGFENWFVNQGGTVLRYRLLSELPRDAREDDPS